MIDWMKRNDVEYEHTKKRAYDREDWHHSLEAWTCMKRQSTQERERL